MVRILHAALVLALAVSHTQYLEKVNSTPGFVRFEGAYEALPGKGAKCCGPLAVANGLVWLSGNSYPLLAPQHGDRQRAVFEVAQVLSSKSYMDTGSIRI